MNDFPNGMPGFRHSDIINSMSDNDKAIASMNSFNGRKLQRMAKKYNATRNEMVTVKRYLINSEKIQSAFLRRVYFEHN